MKLSTQEYRERREKGLCFYCYDKYVTGHKYKNQKIFEITFELEGEKDWWSEDMEGDVTTSNSPLQE